KSAGSRSEMKLQGGRRPNLNPLSCCPEPDYFGHSSLLRLISKKFHHLSLRTGFVRQFRERRPARRGPLSGLLNQRNPQMANVLCVYRNTTQSYGSMSPEEMQQMLQKWQTWISEGLRQGWMVEAGDGLKQEGRVVNAKKVVSDGPFIEVKEMVGGFSIVQADTLDAAAAFAKGCPIFQRGGSVEVRPLQGFTMGK